MMMASSSSGGCYKYHAFLSFRGTDTRKTFVCHLYKALEEKCIDTFMDSIDLDKGKRIVELLDAIEASRVSIVVLSPNYASSRWCLKELVKILDCVDKKTLTVKPIFYDVDIDDIKHIKNKFAEAFAKHEMNSTIGKKELERWRSALTRVANISGWVRSEYPDDAQLIDVIVEDTIDCLIPSSSNKAKGLVGMDSHITEIKSRLGVQQKDVCVVGIWGMGGLGKTEIAEAVCGEIAWQFEQYCFLGKVKEAFRKNKAAKMRELLLSTLFKRKGKTGGFNGCRSMINGLCNRKVLIVLDDVETVSEIEYLLGRRYTYGDGSRIIVTTRNKESLSGVKETYKPMCLPYDKARELFRTYAFRTIQSNGNYDHLSMRVIKYAQGLPLALQVLGESLDNKSVHEWEGMLKQLKTSPNIRIQIQLKTSYDYGLCDAEQNIFLDIACFFRGWTKDFVTKLLASFGFVPDIGLRVLVNRALITISKFDDIQMHDLLQKMGREIVRQECVIEPGKRSRLWSYEDVANVLTLNTATDKVQCLMLDLSKSKFDLCINAGAFVSMKELRLLVIFYSFYSIFDISCKDICPVDGCKQSMKGDLEFLSQKLRFLLWHGCPLTSLPSDFIPKNLVQLDMRGSHLHQLWEGVQPLQNLEVMLLSHCLYLVKIPDLTEAINLKTLSLSGCSSVEKFPQISEVMRELKELYLDGTAIKELPSSVNNLTSLVTLDLQGCQVLRILPSSIHMESLETLNLSGCSNVENFPEISEVMRELKKLYLDGTAIKELPSSVNNLTSLVTLDLQGCQALRILPCSIHMESLETLNLSGCSNVENFPEISEVMRELKKLYLDGTAIKELPLSINLLLGIITLSMQNCRSLESLPDGVCNFAELTELDLSGCSKLQNLPEKFGDLESLHFFDIRDSGIKQLPFSILRLRKLSGDGLSCIGCKEMKAPFSAWPSSIEQCCSYSVLLHLDLSDCNLSQLSDGIAHLSSLTTLKLCRNNLESLPVTMNQLGSLTHLELEACKKLKSIPELSSSIIYIDAHDCTALERVSMPMPPYHQTSHFFTFTNCLKLVQTNLFRDIVERHSDLQDNCLQPLRSKMSLPGSEIPDWFNCQSSGVSVSVHLPLNWFNSKFLGLAICAVLKCQGINHPEAPLSASCVCTFIGNRCGSSFSLDMIDINRNLRSDHMFLGYDHKVLIKKGKLANEAYTEATFQIVSSESLISSCGVRFVYAHPDELPQPQVHVDRNKNRKRRRQSLLDEEISELGSHDGYEFRE